MARQPETDAGVQPNTALWDDPSLSVELRVAARALWDKEREWLKAFHKWEKANQLGASHRTITLYWQRMTRLQNELNPLNDRFWRLASKEDKRLHVATVENRLHEGNLE